ncbi:APC family permease [Pantoea cypripedii]|uniref:APC family permease n=1 Tax=Pantoea cypripedii TaxID=55209 RepID=UPI002FCB0BBF
MTSPVTALNEGNKETGLKGNLTTIGIVLMVLAQAAPLTMMAGVSPLMIGLGNGIGAPLTTLVVGAALLVFSCGFVTMSGYVKSAGAFYSYILKGMGRVVGIGSASVAIVSYAVLVIALEAYLAVIIRDTISETFGLHLHWSLYAVALVLLVGILGYVNIEASAKVLGFALAAEMIIILLADAAVVLTKGIHGLSTVPLQPSSFFSGNVGLGILFAIFGFIGFEATVVYREEVNTPNKTIPRATYFSIVLIAVMYCISIYFTVVGVGLDKVVSISAANPENMYLDFVNTYMGKAFHDIARLLLISSLFAAALSTHNIVSRYAYVLGKTSVLNAKFSRVHVSHSSPYFASGVVSVVSCIVIVAAAILRIDPVGQLYTYLAAVGTLGYMVVITLAALSVLTFFWGKALPHSRWDTKLAPCLSFIAFVGFLMLTFYNISALTGIQGFNLVNAGVIGSLIVIFMAGSLRALYMKAKKPAQFNAILQQEI